MSGERTLHYVCTHKEAGEIVKNHNRFWVIDCGCRVQRGGCSRSRVDVCLQLKEVTAAGSTDFREITKGDVEEILKKAEEKHLVARPFRDEATRTTTEGICFCCDDCCGYFLNPTEKCDKGNYIEMTDMDLCTDCGICVNVCYFGARKMDGEKFIIDRDNCYGCSLCADICPENCIEMASR
jgi:Pyruvate/2-oxoacid:ferredoxin oxidoreductase delta subunit